MIKPDVIDALDADRLLVLFPGYCAPEQGELFGDGGELANWWARRLVAWRGDDVANHVRLHRDFYANPRTPAYMAGIAGELIGRSRVGTVSTLLDPNVSLTKADMPWVGDMRVSKQPLRDITEDDLKIGSCDTVLLLHSDPLGMGLANLERFLLREFPARLFILNGRRRLYRLDRPMSRVLRRHRVLAETRIVESILAKLAGPVSGSLALFDRIAGRNRM